MRTRAALLLRPRRRTSLVWPVSVAALLTATMLATPNARAGLPPGGSSCPLDAAAARVFAHCYRSATVSMTVPPASTAVCEKPPDGPLFVLPSDFGAGDVAHSSSFIYDSSGVLINATVGKSDPAEGPWLMTAKIARAGHNWTITSTVSYDQGAGCFGKGATRRVYALLYYGVPETGTLHVGSVTVSLSERLKRLAGELRPEVDRLVKEKEPVDAELSARRAAFDRAGATVADLAQQVAAFPAKIEQKAAALQEIERSQHLERDAVEVQARDSLDETMARLQPQILAAVLADDQPTAQSLRARLANHEGQLDNLEKALRGKEGQTDYRRTRVLDDLRKLKSGLFDALEKQIVADRERWVAGDELHRTLARAATIDEQLVALGARLADLDFDLEIVSVTADGKKVFEASLSGPGRTVLELDAEIAALKPVLDELDAQRKAAAKQYLDLQNEALAAGKVVADTILKVAYKKAGVDFAYNVYDLVRATSKGGLYGASAETLKKAGEGIVEYLADNDKTGSKELNDRYNGALKDLFGADKLLAIGGKRLAKDLVSKPIKDKLSQAYLGKLFSKHYPDLQLPSGGAAAPAAAAGVVERFRSFAKSFSDREAHLAELKKGFVNPLAGRENAKKFGGNLIGKFLEDASKNLAKAYFDAEEEAAFATYFGKELLARLYFPMWQIASTEYFDALDSYNGLLDRKAELLNGSSETSSRTTLDEKFAKDATLRITVTVSRPAGSSGAIDVEVSLGGERATHAAGYEYTLSATGLKEGAKGVGLRLTAR